MHSSSCPVHFSGWVIDSNCAWPVGLMDKASASGAGDSRFESWAGHVCFVSAEKSHKLIVELLLGMWDPLHFLFCKCVPVPQNLSFQLTGVTLYHSAKQAFEAGDVSLSVANASCSLGLVCFAELTS